MPFRDRDEVRRRQKIAPSISPQRRGGMQAVNVRLAYYRDASVAPTNPSADVISGGRPR